MQTALNLEQLLDALKTIRPSSVESESVFSTMGLMVTKLRSSLDDSSVNALCVL